MDSSLDGLADEDGEESNGETTAADKPSEIDDAKGEKRPAEAPSNGDASEEPEKKRAKAKASRFAKNSAQANSPLSSGTAGTATTLGGRGRGRGRGKGRYSRGLLAKVDGQAEAKSKAKDKADDEAKSEAAKEQMLKVVAPLNLGLNLKIGSVYSAKYLRQRCAGNHAKLQSLEKFMTKPSKLLPVEAPQATPMHQEPKSPKSPRPKSQASPSVVLPCPPSQADEDTRQSTPKRKAKVSSEMSSKPHKPYVFGQVVWHHRTDGINILAKVVQVDHGDGEPIYRLEPFTEGSGCTEEPVETNHSTLTPFEVWDMKKFAPPQVAVDASLPSHREEQPFRVGQVVWWFGEKRPSWPAKIVELPASEDRCKIQLFDPNLAHSCPAGEVLAEPISVARSELLRMERNDLSALSQVMQVVKDQLAQQDAASATTA